MLKSVTASTAKRLNTALVEAIAEVNLTKVNSLLAEINDLSEHERDIALNSPYKGKKLDGLKGQTPLTMLFLYKPFQSEEPGCKHPEFTRTILGLLRDAGADLNRPNADENMAIDLAGMNANRFGLVDSRLEMLCQQGAVREKLMQAMPSPAQLQETTIGKCFNVNNLFAVRYFMQNGLCQSQLLSPTCQDEDNKKLLLPVMQFRYLLPCSGEARSYLELPEIEAKRLFNRDGQGVVLLEENIVYDVGASACYNIVEENKALPPYREPLKENKAQIKEIIADPSAFLEKYPNLEARKNALREKINLPDKKLELLVAALEQKQQLAADCRHGLVVANDIRDMKMLGHRLGLGATFVHQEEENASARERDRYEGFSHYVTTVQMTQNALQFQNCIANRKEYSTLECNAMLEVANTYASLDRAFDHDDYTCQAQRYKAGKPVLIPCKFEGHIAAIVLHNDKLYVVDKGNYFTDNAIITYQINPQLLQGKLLPNILRELSTKERKRNAAPLSLSMLQDLEPKEISRVKLQGQKVGNCSYTNTKRACQAILMALNGDPAHQFKASSERIHELYKGFSLFERKKGIDEYVDKHVNSKNVNKWDPLFEYLHSKVRSDHSHSVELAKFIVNKLKSPPVNLSEEAICEGIARQEVKRDKLKDVQDAAASLLRRFQSNEKSRLSGQGEKNYLGQVAAGLSPDVLRKKRSSTNLSTSKRNSVPMIGSAFERSVIAEMIHLQDAREALAAKVKANPQNHNEINEIKKAADNLNVRATYLHSLLEGSEIIAPRQRSEARALVLSAREDIQQAEKIQPPLEVFEVPPRTVGNEAEVDFSESSDDLLGKLHGMMENQPDDPPNSNRSPSFDLPRDPPRNPLMMSAHSSSLNKSTEEKPSSVSPESSPSSNRKKGSGYF